MAYSVALRIGLLSSCSGNPPLVYPRDVSGNDGWLYNGDIIQMIDYVNNPSGLKFSEIEEIIELKELESGAITYYFNGITSGYTPSWAWSYGCWFGWPCCSEGDYAWELMKNATIEARVYFGSPVNMWSSPASITFGNPSNRAQFTDVKVYWAQASKYSQPPWYGTPGRYLHIEFTANNLEPTPAYPFYYAAMYKEGVPGASSITQLTDENPSGLIRIKESEVADYIPDLYLTWNWNNTDVVHLTIPPFVCDEGETMCDGYDLQECQDNEWVTIEQNSESCGYVPPVCPEGTHEVLEYCLDNVTEKRWRDCVNNQWIENSQQCPGCECSEWLNAECINETQRRIVRTCTPAGCDIEEDIIGDSSCGAKPFPIVPVIIAGGGLAAAYFILKKTKTI